MSGKSGYYWLCCGSEDQKHHRKGCDTMLDLWKFRTWVEKPFENQEKLKINSDIVAWVDTIWIDRPDLANKIGIENMFQRHAAEVRNYIPLYKHPLKELTDEEILKLYVNNSTYDNDQKLFIDIYGFARAILRKAQEK